MKLAKNTTMEQEELIGLIEKYLKGTANTDERKSVLGWYRSIDHSRIEIPLESSLEKNEIRDRVHGRLKQYIAQNRPIRRIKWYRRVAAAAILILITSAGYFWVLSNFKEIKNTPIASSSLKNDLPPGGNKAILTLVNGRKIILDSVHIGQLATQGKSKITKVNSGLLVYNPQPTNHNQQITAIQYNTLATPRGGQYQLILPDGSRVWLNAASSITYPTSFIGNERKVKITGEAYFEIARNADKPFRVEAEGREILVLGTSFNVKAYADDPLMKTTLISGAIKVSNLVLKPGQQDCIDKQTDKTTVKGSNTDNVIAWVHGQLSLQGDDLPTLMRDISRWYNVNVKFEGKVPQSSFVGRIDRDVSLSNVLNALSVYGIYTRIEGRTIIVSEK